MAEDFLGCLLVTMRWGDRWLDDGGGPVELRHRDCGEPVTVELRCAGGHDVTPDELDLLSRRPRRAGDSRRPTSATS